MSYEELLKCDGRKFECKIDGSECKGKITVENGRIYLCQDLTQGGACEDKKGFKCSWLYWDGRSCATSVSDFKLVTYDESNDGE